MKLLNVISGAVLLSLSLTTIANGSTVTKATAYFPPERIHCVKNEESSIRCEGIDHQFLTEDLYTASFENNEDTFSFVSGAAYFTPNMSESTVFFTYKNANNKIMKLKSTSVRIHPDLTHSAWSQVVDGVYVCDAGYMHCPIAN